MGSFNEKLTKSNVNDYATARGRNRKAGVSQRAAVLRMQTAYDLAQARDHEKDIVVRELEVA